MEQSKKDRARGFMCEYVKLCEKWGVWVKESLPGGEINTVVTDDPDALKNLASEITPYLVDEEAVN